MKNKNKRKSPPPDDDALRMVASNVDPSLLVRVPHDNRVNVDDVLDKKLQSEVAKWGQTDSSLRVLVQVLVRRGMVLLRIQFVSKNSTVAPVSRPHIVGGSIGTSLVAPQSGDGGLIAPQTGDGVAVIFGTVAVVHDDGGEKTPAVQVCFGTGSTSDGSHATPLAGESLVFKPGGSGTGSVDKPAVSTVRGPKTAGVVLQRARQALPCGSGARSIPNRNNLPNPLPNRPETAVPGAVLAGPPEGAKVRPQFFEILKDNRIMGNGLKLQQYDPMENDDDVVLDESDEIPFVETWGYCLIGCFTGPFPGRHALDSIVKSWNVKCRIIPYGKGWTVFRFVTDEDRFRVFNGGPYLALC
ncbi:hypothetical protein LIER_27260 [Lithospermum erythrorhizon]|uniref:DUF4283 domain-containing protein n=1 Tax=Lithospermum erythrorhizon TaxID=34254 RepID=A0AAV3REP0_LITER